MAKKRMFLGVPAPALVFGFGLSGCGTLDLNGLIFGKEDTSVKEVAFTEEY
jgi:hypothetical protein